MSSAELFARFRPPPTASRARFWAHGLFALVLFTAVGCDKQRAPDHTGSRSGVTRAVQPPAMSTEIANTTANYPAPWPGPSGAFVFFEGESFAIDGEGWTVVEKAPGKRDRSQASGDRVLSGSAKGKGSAHRVVNLQQGGSYKLWLRVSRGPSNAAADMSRLRLVLRQAGRERLNAIVDPWSAGAQATPNVREEDYAWVQLNVQLEAGPVSLRLLKEGRERVSGDLRALDCALFATDLAYQPDYRDFNEQVYVRLMVHRAATREVPFQLRVTTGRQQRGPFVEPVAVGKNSTWVNATRWFSGADEAHWSTVAGKPDAQLEYTVQFATKPDAEHVVRDVRVNKGGPVNFLMPRQLSHTKAPQADFEFAEARAKQVESWPVVAFGKRPQRFPLITNLDGDSLGASGEKRVLERLGLNGFTGLLSDADVAAGFVHSRLYNSAYYFKSAGHIAPDLEKLVKDLSVDGKRAAESSQVAHVRHLKVIDEAGAMKLEQLAEHEENQQGFKRWLTENQYQPFSWAERQRISARGQDPSQQLRIATSRDSEFPGLYYYSQRFRAYLIAQAFGVISREVHRFYPPNVLPTQNMSDGAVVFANMYHQGNDYFEYFRPGRLDVAMSEDWTNAGATRQLCGWNVALLRAATKYRHQPIHMYNIAYSGRGPVEVKLKALTEISQGTKLLLLYDYSPKYVTASRGWAEKPLVMAAIAELTREIGAAEDVLIDAMPRPAQTAILYSIPQDIWSAGYDISQGNERQFTFVALRQAHVAVDVLSDDDVREGSLAPYKTLYLHGEQLDKRVVPHLAAWVRAGGRLVLSPGAGSRDEWNQPMSSLDQTLGLHRRAIQVVERTLGASLGLSKWKGRANSVKLADGGSALALFVEQRFERRPNYRVLAEFEDATPAAVSLPLGQGQVTAFGFLPATDFVRGATTAFNQEPEAAPLPPYLAAIATQAGLASSMGRRELYGPAPTAYDAGLRRFISQEATRGVAEPVEVAEPLVEATLLEGPAGWVVPLANYGRPLSDLAVRVRPARNCGAIESSHHGALKSSPQVDGSVLVHLPLETTDFIFARCAG